MLKWFAPRTELKWAFGFHGSVSHSMRHLEVPRAGGSADRQPVVVWVSCPLRDLGGGRLSDEPGRTIVISRRNHGSRGCSRPAADPDRTPGSASLKQPSPCRSPNGPPPPPHTTPIPTPLLHLTT